jgi:hypothetical protein
MSRRATIRTLLLALPLSSAIAVIPFATSQAVDTWCGLQGSPGLETFVWKSTESDGAWEDPTKWEGGSVPDNTDAATGYVCIPAGVRVSIGAGIEGRVQAIDVAPTGMLDILEGGKVFVYGDHVARPSHIRAGATLTLTAGTLGGPGRIEMSGAMNWWRTAQVSTMTTDPARVTNPVAPSSLHPGRLVIEESGTLLIDKTSADSVIGGVNLFDRYVIEVDGLLQVDGTTYIAADHGTRFEIGASGIFEFLGDGNVYEGRFDPPSAPLATFDNQGLVRKSGGAGTSAINATYSGGGSVAVLTGSLNVPYTPQISASVAPDGSLGTGSCPEANVCELRTTPGQPQAAVLALPGTAADPDGADVSIAETAAVETAADLQPPLELDVRGLAPGAATNIHFAFDRTIKALPRKGDFDVFHRKADVQYQKLPNCNGDAGNSIPQGVTACVVRTRSNGPIQAELTFQVKSRDPSGRWAVRRRNGGNAAVVPMPNGTFVADNPANLGPVRLLNLTDPAYCGADTSPAWRLVTRWRDQNTNDHAVGWLPSSTGAARGASVEAGDLGRLQGTDLGLEMLGGQLRGFVRVVRHESASVRWVGLARVGLAHTEPARISGQPNWRILDATPLSFTWQKVVDDQVVESEVEATIRQLVDERSPERQAGAPPDQVGYAFGCNGERVLIDDLRVYRTGDGRDDLYDFEAPRPTVKIVGTVPRLNCLTSAPRYPNAHAPRVRFSHAARWQLWWRASSTTRPKLLNEGRAGAGKSRVGFSLKKSGQVAIELLGSDELRRASSGRYAIRAVPRVALLKVTRRVPVGRRIVITGAVQPGGVRRVSLHLVRKSAGAFPWRAADTGRTNRKGDFRLSVRAPRNPGTFALAVKVAGRDGIETAMSNRALFMKVFRPPPAPAPEPQPIVTRPEPNEYAPITPPPTGFTRARAGGCTYRVG